MTLFIILVFLIFPLTGCKVPTLYELPKAATLIIVDDPGEHFGLTGQAQAVAGRIAQDLRRRTKLKDLVIPQRDLDALRNKLGDDYKTTAIDTLGRAVNAEQVIHVEITSAQARVGAGTIKPTASAKVKVIDVVDKKRLFPPPTPPDSAHKILIELPLQAVTIERARAAQSKGIAQAAQKLGREIGRIFYAYDPKSPKELDRSLGEINFSGPTPLPVR